MMITKIKNDKSRNPLSHIPKANLAEHLKKTNVCIVLLLQSTALGPMETLTFL